VPGLHPHAAHENAREVTLTAKPQISAILASGCLVVSITRLASSTLNSERYLCGVTPVVFLKARPK
jgi:hypothetical protein